MADRRGPAEQRRTYRDDIEANTSLHDISTQYGDGDFEASLIYPNGWQDYDEATLGESTIDTTDKNARLYNILEAALPKPGEPENLAGDAEQRRKEQLEETWETARDWFSGHPSPDDRRAAVTFVGPFSIMALHLVCKISNPPTDIVEKIINSSSEVSSAKDDHGMLPLHFASAEGASIEVLSLLCRAYPEGKLEQDNRKRTPLHFTFNRARENKNGNTQEENDGNEENGMKKNSMRDTVALLSDSGAARIPDGWGMLPLHYACAYGTSEAVLSVLEAAYPDSISARERFGRTPLHLAMVNSQRSASPVALQFLLNVRPELGIVNIADNDGHLPLFLLATAAKTERFDSNEVEARSNACKCLTMYLEAQPRASAVFLSALQALPQWLRDTAVLTEHVQDVLNAKMVSNFHAFITFADFYVLIVTIVCFALSTTQFIHFKNDKDTEKPTVTLIIQLVGGIWFLSRETSQVLAMLNLGTFRSWLTDLRNWHDVVLIILLLYLAGLMLVDPDWVDVDKGAFRILVSITQLILYLSVIVFAKGFSAQFAVFAGGLFHVMERTLAFFVIPIFLLLMFANMFLISYAGSELCEETVRLNNDTNATMRDDISQECYEDFPHCDFGESLLQVYSMMLGEIGNECRYQMVTTNQTLELSENWKYASGTAQGIYFLYALVVVIILSTMLIAIATDSYDVIKNERAEMVFWSNRLDFVAEMDAILKFKRTVIKIFLGRNNHTAGVRRAERDFQEGNLSGEGSGRFRNFWTFLLSLFGSNSTEEESQTCCSPDFWLYQVLRILAVFIIPLWLLVGFIPFGIFLPPQVKEFILVQKRTSLSTDTTEQVYQGIKKMKHEMKKTRLDFKKEMKMDQKELIQMKAEVETLQRDVLSDLSQLKENLITLSQLARERMREREEYAMGAR